MTAENTSGRKLNRQEWRALKRAEAKKKPANPQDDDVTAAVRHSLAYIDADIAKRNIKKSPSELFLWPQYADFTPQGRPVTSEEDIYTTYRKANDALSSMELSANPYFSRTFRKIVSGLRKGDIISETRKNLPYNRNAVMAVLPDIESAENERIIWVLGISLEAITRKPNGVSIALFFVHEMDHIERGDAFFASLDPALSAGEKLERYEDYFGVPENRLQVEASAEAQMSEAFIYQMALGYEERLERDHVIQAGKYLEFGRNPESQDWKNYLRSLEWKNL